MNFGVTASSVLVMLLYAIPAFVLVKTKMVRAEILSGLSVILLYMCQPCLQLYSFQRVGYSRDLFGDIALVFLFAVVVESVIMLALYLVFRRKYDDARYRVCTVASALGNVGFMGVPILTVLLPDYPQAICFSAVFIVGMNLLAWTMGSFLLTGDKRFMSVKKLILNPAMLSLFVALPLFFLNVSLADEIPVVYNAVELLGKMTTPLCMIIVGMRFATVNIREMFRDYTMYISCAVKLVIMPMFALLAGLVVPMSANLRATLFILCAMPTASIVLNLAEIYDGGQKYAANTMLMCTLFSMITIPLVLLLV